MRINRDPAELVLAEASRNLDQFRMDFLVALDMYQSKLHSTRLNFSAALIARDVELQVELAAELITRRLRTVGEVIINVTSFGSFVSAMNLSRFENLETFILVYLIDAVLRQNEEILRGDRGAEILEALFDFVKQGLNLSVPTDEAALADVVSAPSAAVSAAGGVAMPLVAVEHSPIASKYRSFSHFVLAQWAIELKDLAPGNQTLIGSEHDRAMKKYKTMSGNLSAKLVLQFLSDLVPEPQGSGFSQPDYAVFTEQAGRFADLAMDRAVGFNFDKHGLVMHAGYLYKQARIDEVLRAILMVMLTHWDNTDVRFDSARDFRGHFENLKRFVNVLTDRYGSEVSWLRDVQYAFNRFELFEDASVVPSYTEAQEAVIERCRQASRTSGIAFTDAHKARLEGYVGYGLPVAKADVEDAIVQATNSNIQEAGLAYSAKLGVLLQDILRVLPPRAGDRGGDPALDRIIAILVEELHLPEESIRARIQALLLELEKEARRNGGVARRTIDIQTVAATASRAASVGSIVPTSRGLMQSVVGFFRFGRAQAGAQLERTPDGLRLQVGVHLGGQAATGAEALAAERQPLIRRSSP